MNVGTIDTNFSCAWSFIALAIAISISVPGTILNKGNTYVVSADVMCAFFFKKKNVEGRTSLVSFSPMG